MKQIPTVLTLLNLLCGCLAVLFVLTGDLFYAAIFVITGILFDLFDGMAARALNASSEVGVALDSLADLVTSALAPALALAQILALHFFETELLALLVSSTHSIFEKVLPLTALFIVLSAAYRLAYFNVYGSGKSNFSGLPTPAAALWVFSLPITSYFINASAEVWYNSTGMLIGILILITVLMHLPIPLFSLKFKRGVSQNYWPQILFFTALLCVVIALGWQSLPLIIPVYLLSSLAMHLPKGKN